MKNIWYHIWESLGFESLTNYLAITFANQSAKSVFVQVVVGTTAAAALPPLVEKWVYFPISAIVLISAMVVVDTLLGAFVAIKDGEEFNIAKFTRLAPILISHLSVMSASFHMAQIDTFLFSWLPQAVFAFFAGRNLMSIVRNMVILKWLRGDFLQYLIDRIKPDLFDAMKPDAKPVIKNQRHEKNPDL
jgi:bacteriorhodopsin